MELIDRSAILPHLVAAGASGDRVFVEDVTGTTLTYAQVHDDAMRWAGVFEELGVTAGDRVATQLATRPGGVAIWLGLAWLGAIDTGVNTELRGATLRHVLNDSAAKVVVTERELLERATDVAGDLAHRPTVVVLDEHGRPPEAAPPTSPHVPEPWDVACLLYTSGTTGPSKGVLVPWAQLHASATGLFPEGELGEDEAFYDPFAMCHMSGRLPMQAMAACQGRVVTRRALSATQYWADVRGHGCTTAITSHAVLDELLREAEGPDDLGSLPVRRLVVGPVSTNATTFARRFGVRMCTAHNMTEISCATWAGWSVDMSTGCGRPREGYPGYELRIVDEHDRPVPDGAVGELMVRTAVPWTLNAGYFGDPELTARAWRNGWFHTGDAFRRDGQGNFHFVDRLQDCIRRRGENISSFEVENHVNEHPAVAASAAVAVQDPQSGQEVKVFVVPSADSQLDPAELIAFLTPRMPRFMIPRYIEFTHELPRTDATLKVRKALLRQQPLNERTWDRVAAGILLPR